MKRWFNSKGVTTLRSRTVNLEPPQEPSSLSRFSAGEGRFQRFLRCTPGSAPTPTICASWEGSMGCCWHVLCMSDLLLCALVWIPFRMCVCVHQWASRCLPHCVCLVQARRVSSLEFSQSSSRSNIPALNPVDQTHRPRRPEARASLRPHSVADSQCSRLPQLLSWRLVPGLWSSRLLSHRPLKTATQRAAPLI